MRNWFKLTPKEERKYRWKAYAVCMPIGLIIILATSGLSPTLHLAVTMLTMLAVILGTAYLFTPKKYRRSFWTNKRLYDDAGKGIKNDDKD